MSCEPEYDAARGVLSFLDVDQLFSSNYYGDSTQHDIEICHEQYSTENPYHPSYCNVDNDEVIAHALQEEWSELYITEDAQSSHADDQYLQASTGVQHWHGSPREYYAGIFLVFNFGIVSRVQTFANMHMIHRARCWRRS